MRALFVCLSASLLLLGAASLAAAQTTLSVSADVVTPGSPITATVTGPPGQFYAIIGSSVGSGISYGGVALGVGLDFAILAQGVLDGTGSVSVPLTPPFRGSVLDRYYLQAATSSSPAFIPLSVSAGRVLRNGDLVSGLTGPAGPPGPTGPIGPAGLAGSIGPIGPAGPTGPAGISGAIGSTGPTGQTGPPGTAGAAGATGPLGPTGPTGATGSPGVVVTNAAGSYDFGNVNGFVAAGTFGSGNIGATGNGTRLLWYPRKAAFRAGQVSGTESDDANIGTYSVAMGDTVAAIGARSVAIGSHNIAGGANSLALGADAWANGANSVAIGTNLIASGNHSVVIGRYAAAAFHAGTFVFGDASTTTPVSPSAPNQFVVRATGGATIYTAIDPMTGNPTLGVTVDPGGGAWEAVSDANLKANFRDLDGEDVLFKLARIPIREWNYLTQDPGIKHVGPTAQDFHAAFGLGASDRRISTLDPDGISLKAIQALDARSRTDRDAIARLAEESAATRARIAELERGVNDGSIGLQDIDGVSLAAVMALDSQMHATLRDVARLAEENAALKAELADLRKLFEMTLRR